MCVILRIGGLCTSFFFFFNDTATTEIYTLSLHDALPISQQSEVRRDVHHLHIIGDDEFLKPLPDGFGETRSEEHTSELQSRLHLVCRLLLEKKKKSIITSIYAERR